MTDGGSLLRATSWPLRRRVAVAMLAGLSAAVLVVEAHPRGGIGESPGDFIYPWSAARALLAGRDPYSVIRPRARFAKDQPYRFAAPFVYPLPAGVVTAPFALLPSRAAGVLFFGLSVALLTYALTRYGDIRLAALVSAPVLWGAQSVQWAPLLTAAALLPEISWLLIVKPNLGAALWGYCPNRRAVLAFCVGGAALVAVSFALVPSWPSAWLAALRAHPDGGQYRPPVLLPGGALALLALLRWRRPEARLIAAMACVPQNFFLYEFLPLIALVPETRAQTMAMALLSYVAYGYWFWSGAHALASTAERSLAMAPAVLVLLYLPALVLVLRRPNHGQEPAWADAWGRRIENRFRRVPSECTPSKSKRP